MLFLHSLCFTPEIRVFQVFTHVSYTLVLGIMPQVLWLLLREHFDHVVLVMNVCIPTGQKDYDNQRDSSWQANSTVQTAD